MDNAMMVPALQKDVWVTLSCWESHTSQTALQLHCKQGANRECHEGNRYRAENNLRVKPISPFRE